MPDKQICLVTGGAGYFGSVLVQNLLGEGWQVRVLDLNIPDNRDPAVEYVQGDVRDFETCLKATRGIGTIFHNIAQVPLANNVDLFREVNILGTRNICEAAKLNSVSNFIYTSSSAVYGIPSALPVKLTDNKLPIEAYGRAKLEGEEIVNGLKSYGVEVKVVRPRTILGLGRLGIFGILFQWIDEGVDVYTLGRADGHYQFIHALDLANGIRLAAGLSGSYEFNLGATKFDSLRIDLVGLCDYSGSGSRVINLPENLFRGILRILTSFRILPFATYQLRLYSKPMFFDSQPSWDLLGYTPKYSNLEMLIDSFNWYKGHKAGLSESSGSLHQRTIRTLSVTMLTQILKVLTRFRRFRTDNFLHG